MLYHKYLIFFLSFTPDIQSNKLCACLKKQLRMICLWQKIEILVHWETRWKINVWTWNMRSNSFTINVKKVKCNEQLRCQKVVFP